MQPSDERMGQLVRQLQQDPALAEQMPSREGEIVRAALRGQTVYDIAQTHQMSENAVWGVLRNAARAASGQPVTEVETGGYYSDSNPGAEGDVTVFGGTGDAPLYPTPDDPQGEG